MKGRVIGHQHQSSAYSSVLGTKWSSLLFFTESATGGEQRFVFSAKTDPKALFAYEKKVPEFSLMGRTFLDTCLSGIELKIVALS